MTIRSEGSAAATKAAQRGRVLASAKRERVVEQSRRFAVIMAGGSGTRFWPWSREARPKQLLQLTTDRSMLAETVGRLEGFVPKRNILIVVGLKHRRQVLAELSGIDAGQVLAEPVGRNTAACIGWATSEILSRCADAVTAVFSADHLVGDRKAFLRDLEAAYALADRRRCLVTFGVAPGTPETGYGYIKAGRALERGSTACEVAAFVEKPNPATARRYVASGKYFWNAGIFVWRADVIAEEIARHLPALAAGLDRMNKHRRRGVVPAAAVERAYGGLPAISIDYGVLEKSDRVAMLPASFPWSDIGSWDAVSALWPADRNGNSSRDPMLAIEASGNLVATRGKPVVLLGVDGIVVVDAGDALLVCDRKRCQDVKMVSGLLEKAGLGNLR
ncbi:MAG TPA: sugar phosphate nucleotidyltransferase [Candidatus Limnocylindrales bacterium]|nr:sugar phosphate nucleotidyltransferase [Candidatus Limnocylindrales bacterium]